MTPPRPTASAAELREVFIGEWNTREHWDSGGARMGAALDALIAAVRAEALEEAAKEMRDQFDASKHDLDLNGIIKCRTYKDAELRIRALVSK